MTTDEQFADEIVALVERRPGLSFVELGARWPQHFRDGELELIREGEAFSNIVLWGGLSSAGSRALREALRSNRIHYRPTATLVYLIDGVALQSPIAKSLRHYRKPHWLPVALYLGSLEEFFCDRRRQRTRTTRSAGARVL